MVDKLDFLGGIFLGTLLGSLAALIYHVRQAREEVRRSYIQLSLAQMEITTLRRTLESHLNSLSKGIDLSSPSSSNLQDPASAGFNRLPQTWNDGGRQQPRAVTAESARSCGEDTPFIANSP